MKIFIENKIYGIISKQREEFFFLSAADINMWHQGEADGSIFFPYFFMEDSFYER